MSVKEKIKEILKPKMKLLPGTRLTSFLFIAASIAIAFGILFAANIYYNIDTGEIISEEIFSITGQNKELRFTVGSNYISFKAPSSFNDQTYVLPTGYPTQNSFLQSDTSGQLSWVPASSAGSLRRVGDVPDGSSEAFTTSTGTQYGRTLWFHPNNTNLAALTVDTNLNNNATYTLPAVPAGTYYFALATTTLSNGQVLFASGNYTLSGSDNLKWISSDNALAIGTTNVRGQLRLYSNNTNYLAFTPVTSLGSTVTYTWPAAPTDPSNTYVLTSDTSGNLSWQTVTSTGGVAKVGSPQAGWVAYWASGDAITGEGAFAWDANNDTLTIGGTIVANLYTSNSTTTIQSGSGYGILLDPNSGIVQLGSGDYIKTSGGYEIGKTGTQILREMVPIMGFDLPVQTATTGWAKISRVVENYPFSATSSGTTRVHKLVFRYAASTTNPINVRINAEGNPNYSTTTLPVPESTNLDDGQLYIVPINIPMDGTDWQVDVQTVAASDTVRIYQLFLAAYDQIL